MGVTEVIEVITNQGLAIGLVSLTVIAIYKGSLALWQHYIDRVTKRDEKDKRQEKREEKTLKALEDCNRTILETTQLNKELSETNKMLVGKLTLDVIEIKEQVTELNTMVKNRNEKE